MFLYLFGFLCAQVPSGLSGHVSIFCLVFLVLKSLLGIVRQWSREKLAILSSKSCLYIILIYQTWACVVKAVTKILSGQVYAISTYVGGKSNS